MPERTKPPPSETVTYSSGTHDGPPDLRLLHYNDVYHVDSSSAEPVGGVARFMTLVKHYREDEKFQGQPDLLTMFSGDAFNPSLESSVTKGMFCALNATGGLEHLDTQVPPNPNTRWERMAVLFTSHPIPRLDGS